MKKPASNRTATTSLCPFLEARCNGQCLNRGRWTRSGNFISNNWTTSFLPYCAARSSGDSSWRFLMFGFACFCSKTSTTARWPYCDAQCSAVSPLWFWKWAVTWQNQQSDCAPSLIRVFAVRMKKSWVLSYPLSAQRRLWSDWVDAQADLSTMGAQSLCWFCHVVDQINVSHVLRKPVFGGLQQGETQTRLLNLWS